MKYTTARELRTVDSRVRKDGPGAWSIVRNGLRACGVHVIATIKGRHGSYVATVYDDGGITHTSPAYKRFDDVIEAAIASEIGAVRGESWSFPSVDRYAEADA